MIDSPSSDHRAKARYQKFFRQCRVGLRKLQQLAEERKIRESTLNAFPYVLAAALVGGMAVFYAKLFLFAEEWTSDLYGHHPLLAFALAPILFFAAWWIVETQAPAAGGSGIPQLMAAAEIAGERDSESLKAVNALLGIRVFCVKVASSIICVLGGGAIGREGPTLQLAGSTFYLTNRLLRKTASRYIPTAGLQSMIITGGAAGLAAAFNTPLGGIVYAVEELAKVHLSFFRTSLIQAVIVSGIVAQLFLGSYLYLGLPNVTPPPWSMMGWVIAVGALVGLCGALAGKALFSIGRLRTSLKRKHQRGLFAIGCGLLFAALFYLSGPVALGSGKHVLLTLLFSKEQAAEWYAPFSRFAGNLLAYGTGAAGGVFAPALATGATLGSLLSDFATDLDANVFILIGMIAFLTGVTRTPFTSFVLVLEMTDRHSVIFPMMIGAMSAHAAASLVDPESLYERVMKQYL